MRAASGCVARLAQREVAAVLEDVFAQFQLTALGCKGVSGCKLGGGAVSVM